MGAGTPVARPTHARFHSTIHAGDRGPVGYACSMRRLGLGLLFCSCWWVACGGQVDHDVEMDLSDASAGQAGSVSQAGSSSVPMPVSAGNGGVVSDFTDPGCPDVEPTPAVQECDPLAAASSCPPGQGCYPFVQHPFGEGCGTQVFGTACRSAGSGSQGDRCGEGFGGCAPGFLCVVGTRAGSRCAMLCRFDEADDCPAGLICGDTDVEGWGVCA